MLFNSFGFLMFFLITTIIYYIIPHKFRWILLLLSSYVFYMNWAPIFIILLVFITFINFIASLLIYHEQNAKLKKNLLVTCLIINFSFLAIFKYALFFTNSVISFLNAFDAEIPYATLYIILPMGISFFIFQATSYTIDVYKEKIKPIKHYGLFSLFIAFYPQLVAGPIERSEHLLPQFKEEKNFNLHEIVYGLKIMIYGFFKKMVIADRLSVAVDTIYNAPNLYSGLALFIATTFFAFQVYCDFSGYSDIAVGCARVLGFKLMYNFKAPFLSKNAKELWTKWHVSLTYWFRDYVYIPLGGNSLGNERKYLNTLITFTLSGLWHGASWNYAIWGAVSAVFKIISEITEKYVLKVRKLFGSKANIFDNFSIFVTFLTFVFSLIFFRSTSLSDAIYILNNMLADFGSWFNFSYFYNTVINLGISSFEFIISIIAISFLMTMEKLSGDKQVFDYFETVSFAKRYSFYVVITIMIFTWGVFYNAGEFIYFQF